MTISIEVHNEQKPTKFVDPIDCWGAKHGVVYQQWFDGKPQRDFLIGAGHAERPINIWWDDECKQYRISSDSKKSLKGFVNSVKYAEVKADVFITLDIK